jgi:predicted MPP superfamily phosphohydrolase
MQILFFFLFVQTIIGLLLYYLYRNFKKWNIRVWQPSRESYNQYFRWALVGVYFLIASRFLVGLLDLNYTIFGTILVYVSGFLFAGIAGATVLIFAGKTITLPIRRIVQAIKRKKPEESFSPARRQFIKYAGTSFIGSAIGVPVLINTVASRDYKIANVELHFEQLPPGLKGLKIAQISDIHSGNFMREGHMSEIFELVSGTHPDIIVITGDMIDANPSEIPPLLNTIDLLKAQFGVYAVLGNHDHYAGAGKVRAALEQKIKMLVNAGTTLDINGEKLAVLGIDDAGRRANFADLPKTMANISYDHFKVLLSHRPTFFPIAKSANVDLTLAGHTHGGQVGIEAFGLHVNPVHLFYRYARGLYEEDGKKLYVNPGVGMVGAPVRTVPPEITLLTLLPKA